MWIAILVALAGVGVDAGGVSDHPVAGTSPNVPLSGAGSLATWILSAGASDGLGCDAIQDTDLNTTQFLAKVPAATPTACCAACRANPACMASVHAPSTHTCTLHNLTGLMARVASVGHTACFLGPAANPAVAVPAAVPGDHLTDLQTAGLIPDPLKDSNFKNATVWGARDWTYTATFTAPESLTGAGSVLLVFDGVKMGARITLNGKVLGTVVDQFLRYSFDVAGALRLGKENTVVVEFDQEIFVNGRFMACSGGWDWAPYATTYNRWGTQVFTLGIWKDVYLVPIAPKSAAITHVVPSITYTGPYPTEPLTDATASPFQVGVTLHTWAPQPTTATLAVAGSWGEGGFTSGTISVPAGDGKISTVLTAKGVKLWWPNGFGEQPLYNLTASLTFAFGDKTDSDSAPLRIGSAEHGESDQTGESARGSTEVVAGVSGRGETAVASSTRRVGFRYLVLVTGNDTDPAYVAAAATQDGSAPKGGVTTFIFRVNGAPVFAKGGNLVPMEELEGRASGEAMRYLVKNAADAGFTILRNWGGGIFQYDAWYDALDEFGILCYQDLMYAQGQHSPTYGDPTQAAEIAHQVRRLSHHPSLSVYTSCNECIFHGNMTLYVNFAMEVVANETQCTPLWPSCPAPGWASGVNRLTGYANGNPLQIGGHTLDLHGPYIKGCTTAFQPADGCFGAQAQDPFKVSTQMLVNASIWPPWGRSGPIGVDLTGTAFSEYGFTVMSSFESMSATLSPENWGVNQPAFADRNYPCDNFIHAFFGTDHSNVSAIGAAALQRQTWQCMIAQALAQKQYTEALRSMNTVLVQFWQYNEIWPTGGWGSIEYGSPVAGQVVGGRWKPLQHFLKRSIFATVGAACMVDGRCYVRNDGKTAFTGSLRLRLIKLATGSAAMEVSHPLSIARGAHTVQWVCVKGEYTPGGNCTDWGTILASAGCTISTCVFNADVLGPATAADASNRVNGVQSESEDERRGVDQVGRAKVSAVLSSNQQLLAPPGQLEIPPNPAVKAVVGEVNPDGSIGVTVSGEATAVLVTLTSLASGVFSDNAFLLTPAEPHAITFTPYGDVTPAELKASLRVVHLAMYL